MTHQSEIALNAPGSTYTTVGTGMGAIMWFWIEWRAYHDLPHMLVRAPLARAGGAGGHAPVGLQAVRG